MNFALPAVLIFLIISPGIIARYSYRKGLWKSPTKLGLIQNELIYGLVWASFIHLIIINSLRFIEWLSKKFSLTVFDFPPIKYDTIVILLTGWTSLPNDQVTSYINSISNYPLEIFGYFAFASSLGFVLGYCLHFSIRNLSIDLIIPFFRFNNTWHYIFSGENLIIDRIKSSKVISKRLPQEEKKYVNEYFFNGKKKYINKIQNLLDIIKREENDVYNKFLEIDSLEREQAEASFSSNQKDEKKEDTIVSDIESYINKWADLTTQINQKKALLEQRKRELYLRTILHRPYTSNKFKNLCIRYQNFSKIQAFRRIFIGEYSDTYLNISCMMVNGENVNLYLGVLVDYIYKNGEIEKIVLTNAYRTDIRTLDHARNNFELIRQSPQKNFISDDLESATKVNKIVLESWEDCLEEIEGEYLILKYSDLRNINIDRSDNILSQII